MSFAFALEEVPATRCDRFTHRAEALAPNARAGLDDFIVEAGDELRRILRVDGVCLLRGAPVDDAGGFQRLLEGLGFDLDDKYLGGAAPRSRIRSAIFNSTEAGPKVIIGYHTEQSYQFRRSSVIAFYCQIAPDRYGETPVFDAARVFDELPRQLQEELVLKGVQYRRYFPAEAGDLNFLKPWRVAFGTDDEPTVEAILADQGVEFEWLDDGGLATSIAVPAIVADPHSGRPCLNVNLYEQYTWAYVFRRFKERYEPTERRGIVGLMTKYTVDPHPFLQTRLGDGRPFTRAESEAIQKAAWDNADIFDWRKGDILLINNVRYAHARLNVVSDRMIYAALAAPFDVRDMSGNFFARTMAR